MQVARSQGALSEIESELTLSYVPVSKHKLKNWGDLFLHH